ncbi:MAG: hypothetical protein AB1656_00115, partial [Candidatus Omnitrophota bacterium]
MKKTLMIFLCLSLTAPALADRGGWKDPAGGWTFVEEWHKIPEYTNDPVWDHNNGSDSYSGNSNSPTFADLAVEIAPGVPVGDVVSINTVAGVGETEDGKTKAADAIAMRLIDLGDPRKLNLADPSDRKIFFLGALHKPGELTEDPFIKGITYCARFRIFPIAPDPDIGVGLDLVNLALDPDGDGVPNGDGLLHFIPEASDRAHVGVGYVDPADDLARTLVGVGYYTDGTLSILINDKGDPDGDENIPILTGIDTAAFHTVWVSAKLDANDPTIVNVRAFGDGSTTPVLANIQRGSGVDRPDPEDLQDNAAWAGKKEIAFNIGSAGTNAAGGFQYDYFVATMAGA